MIKEAIILAGGFGTRLQTEVKNLPKPMALVCGKPFLEYQLKYLYDFGIQKIVLAVSYKAEIIKNYFGSHHKDMVLEYSYEDIPLGTGGAILQAIEFCDSNDILVINGDTFFECDFTKFYKFHIENNFDFTIAINKMYNVDRYGVVHYNIDNKVNSFDEKKHFDIANINTGNYIINRYSFLENVPNILNFSLEKDFLEKKINKINIGAFESENYFIDIGIPEDYNKVQIDFKQKIKDKLTIDNTWTIFLDRDGVINKMIENSYVLDITSFEFIENIFETLAYINNNFARIIVVTNQRCVAKGLTSIENIENIHKYMIKEINNNNGRIDAVYIAPELSTIDDSYRKPNPNMAFLAKKNFPEINFEKSIMVGDSPTDIEFAKNAGIKYSVFVRNGINKNADYNFDNLYKFIEFIKN